MSDSTDTGKKTSLKKIIFPLAVLALGFFGMRFIISHKKPPKEIAPHEMRLPASVMTVQPSNHTSTITAYGPVHALHSAAVSPEVGGRVTVINPRLLVGEVFKKDEMLFKIDPRDYQLALDSARAESSRLSQNISLLEKQMQLNKARLPSLKRIRDLAKAEMDRVEKLYQNSKVGTQSGVDQAESAYQRTLDQYTIVKNQIDLLPNQIAEARAGLKRAEAQTARARLNLERCTVRAPFTGRIKQRSIYLGDMAAPGKPALIMADDSILEISVPLDALTARRLMRFLPPDSAAGSWFSRPEQVPCRIRWTENPDGHVWTGRVDRIESLSADTRTLRAAVRVSRAEAARVPPHTLPLADGMFCSVEIPGKVFTNTVQLPRQAVTLKSEVYVAQNNRLHRRPVHVAWFDTGHAYIDRGLTNGEQVITTRLIAPIENSLLKIVNSGKARP